MRAYPDGTSESPAEARPKRQFVAYTHEWLRKFGPMLNESERRAYDALAVRFAPGQDGLVWMKLGTIAQMTGYTRRQTVAAAIEGLRTKGLIEVITWPVTLGRGGKRGEVRTIGGGKEAGKHNVFVMLHVDEQGYHRSDRVRPTLAECRDSFRARAELERELFRRALAGQSYDEVRDYILKRFPFAKDVPYWAEPAPEGEKFPEKFDLDGLMMAATFLTLEDMDHRYPDGGRLPRSMLWGERGAMDRCVEAQKYGGWALYEAAERAVRPVRQEVLAEMERLTSTHAVAMEKVLAGEVPEFAHMAPITARLWQRLDVCPRYLFNIAGHQAVDDGDILWHPQPDGEICIKCKDPDQWVKEDVARQIFAKEDCFLSEAEKATPPRERLDAMLAARDQMVRAFAKALNEPPPRAPITRVRWAQIVSDYFNSWADERESRTRRTPPLERLTPQRLIAIWSEADDQAVRNGVCA